MNPLDNADICDILLDVLIITPHTRIAPMTDNNNNILVMSGKEEVNAFRLLSLKSALNLECKGLKMSRGRSAYAIIKDEFGFKGNKEKVLTQFITHLNNIGVYTHRV